VWFETDTPKIVALAAEIAGPEQAMAIRDSITAYAVSGRNGFDVNSDWSNQDVVAEIVTRLGETIRARLLQIVPVEADKLTFSSHLIVEAPVTIEPHKYLRASVMGAAVGFVLGAAVACLLYFRRTTVLSEDMVSDVTDLDILADLRSPVGLEMLATKLRLRNPDGEEVQRLLIGATDRADEASLLTLIARHASQTPSSPTAEAVRLGTPDGLTDAAANGTPLVAVRLGHTAIRDLRTCLTDLQQVGVTPQGIVLI
jgi:hypothetical protein